MKLLVHKDERGVFAEIYKAYNGQVSFITINPGHTRGNHYHKVQTEQFIVISGEAIISTRTVGSLAVHETMLSSESLEAFAVYRDTVHNIRNDTSKECIVLLITDIPFNKDDTDTYPEAV